MKRFVCILLICLLLFSLSGCTGYEYEYYATEFLGIGYSEYKDKAFVGGYRYDLTKNNNEIIIPEEYNGIKITDLGGYYGLGVPTPFGIEPVKESLPDHEAVSWIGAASMDMLDTESHEIIYLDFKLHISKNIESFTFIDLDTFILVDYYAECKHEDPSTCQICETVDKKSIAYLTRFFITCDDENAVFYSKDGKLYHRSNDTPVDNIIYFDFIVN